MSRECSNLFWGNHSADLLNFGRSQTISLLSRPKFSKSYKSTTTITSIVLHTICATFYHSERGALARSEESKKIPSLRDSRRKSRNDKKLDSTHSLASSARDGESLVDCHESLCDSRNDGRRKCQISQ